MIITTVPGFSALFGKPTLTYNDYLQGIPTYQIIEFLVGINHELSTPGLSPSDNQRRILRLIGDGLTPQQSQTLNQAYAAYRKRRPDFDDEVFENMYIMRMIVKELNRNFDPQRTIKTSPDEYNIVMAYLLIVDEVQAVVDARIAAVASLPKDNLSEYRIVWTTLIDQLEFVEAVDPVFSIYKLYQLFNFLIKAYPEYLKEYLQKYSFSTPGEFMGSIISIAKSSFNHSPGQPLQKVAFIVPGSSVDQSHLKALLIDSEIGKKQLTLTDIRKFPLFDANPKGYLIIDTNMFLRKIYLGPFFEIVHNTSLKTFLQKTDKNYFNIYSTIISDNVLEKACFKRIVEGMVKSKHDCLHTDDSSPNSPDGYYRNNKTIFIIEFKGYIFPEGLSTTPSFDKIKDYIDQRFIEKEGGTAKGITQLANQIVILAKGGFSFDQKFNQTLIDKNYTIYPIICHTDHYFSLPAVNTYLNEAFNSIIAGKLLPNVTVKSVTVIDLVHLFSMATHDKNFLNLKEYIDTYHQRIAKRVKRYAKDTTPTSHVQKHASFDEMYIEDFEPEVSKNKRNPVFINELAPTMQAFNTSLP
jgi:hypothetical protein